MAMYFCVFHPENSQPVEEKLRNWKNRCKGISREKGGDTNGKNKGGGAVKMENSIFINRYEKTKTNIKHKK